MRRMPWWGASDAFGNSGPERTVPVSAGAVGPVATGFLQRLGAVSDGGRRALQDHRAGAPGRGQRAVPGAVADDPAGGAGQRERHLSAVAGAGPGPGPRGRPAAGEDVAARQSVGRTAAGKRPFARPAGAARAPDQPGPGGRSDFRHARPLYPPRGHRPRPDFADCAGFAGARRPRRAGPGDAGLSAAQRSHSPDRP
ncbi:hypothetical protein D3C78_1132040 [compost metagenome]